MIKQKLLIDFDDVICTSTILSEINSFLGTNYKIEDFKDYLLDDIIPNEQKEAFYQRIANVNFYDNSKIVKGAKSSLLKLSKKYDIYICSSCVLIVKPNMSGPHFTSKFNFLINNFPFLDPRKFVFTSSKDVVCGDIFIDDYLGNLKRSPAKEKFLFSSYHNKQYSDEELKSFGVLRVDSWQEICKRLL